MSTVTKALQQDRLKRGVTKLQPESILTVVMDDHSVHCMNESMLDAWWRSLSPEQKAAVYEADLDAAPALQAFDQKADSFLDQLKNLAGKPYDVLGKLIEVQP